MHISYDTKGICAAKIDFDLEEGKVYNLKFNSGCDGNHKGLAKLVEGVTCGPRVSSCPDQLAQALESYLKNQ